MLTAWLKSLGGYPEERVLDTVSRIFDPVGNTEVYLLKDWVLDKPDQFASWDNLVLPGIRITSVCDYHVNNLKWSRKTILNSISLDLWDFIEKDLVIGATKLLSTQTLSLRFSKSVHLRIRNLVDDLRNMSLFKNL